MEERDEGLVCGQATEERTVESVHGLTETSEQETSDESPCDGRTPEWFLFEEGFIVRLAALDDLDLGDVGLSNQSVTMNG